MIPEIRNHSYHQRIQDLDLISLVLRRLRGQVIEVFKYLNRFTTARARGLIEYDFVFVFYHSWFDSITVL